METDVSASRDTAETLLIQIGSDGCWGCLLPAFLTGFHCLSIHLMPLRDLGITLLNCKRRKMKATTCELNPLILVGKGEIDFIYLESKV